MHVRWHNTEEKTAEGDYLYIGKANHYNLIVEKNCDLEQWKKDEDVWVYSQDAWCKARILEIDNNWMKVCYYSAFGN